MPLSGLFMVAGKKREGKELIHFVTALEEGGEEQRMTCCLFRTTFAVPNLVFL